MRTNYNYLMWLLDDTEPQWSNGDHGFVSLKTDCGSHGIKTPRVLDAFVKNAWGLSTYQYPFPSDYPAIDGTPFDDPKRVWRGALIDHAFRAEGVIYISPWFNGSIWTHQRTEDDIDAGAFKDLNTNIITGFESHIGHDYTGSTVNVNQGWYILNNTTPFNTDNQRWIMIIQCTPYTGGTDQGRTFSIGYTLDAASLSAEDIYNTVDGILLTGLSFSDMGFVAVDITDALIDANNNNVSCGIKVYPDSEDSGATADDTMDIAGWHLWTFLTDDITPAGYPG